MSLEPFPPEAPPPWCMDGALDVPPVPGAGRDGSLVQELDRSFGSSMSISSMDSPSRSARRGRPTALPCPAPVEDPFSMPLAPAPVMPMPAPPQVLASSPQAMEISSPAVPSAAPGSVLVQTSVQPPLLRRLERSSRKSMPSLWQGAGLFREPLSPSSPEHSRPWKKRFAATRTLQDASFEVEGVIKCDSSPMDTPLAGRVPADASTSAGRLPVPAADQPPLSDVGLLSQGVSPRADNSLAESGSQSRSRTRWHVRSQSASLWWEDEGDEVEDSLAHVQPPFSALGQDAPPTSADDSNASDSFPAPAPLSTSPQHGTLPLMSPIGGYFLDPQSPGPQTIPAASSPVVSPKHSARSGMPLVRNWSLQNRRPSGAVLAADGGPHDGPVLSDLTQSQPTLLLPSAPASPKQGLALSQAKDAAVGGADESMGRHGGSPMRPLHRIAMRRTQTAVGGVPFDKENVPLVAPPATGAGAGTYLPGFGTHEMDRKVLPCFSVKSDGLMRVTPETVRDLIGGQYDDKIAGFQIVDCRFGYEFEGGHIDGAVNLSTVEQVRQHFLVPGRGLHADRPLPPRTESGMPDAHGSTRKFVLIFHCEFSHKRGPSMALALRQADRSLASDYPRCHFPDIYVMQGGYASFFQTSPQQCIPQAYVMMDDPRFLQRRSSELSDFRRQFTRHRSFAYGDGQLATTAAASRGAPPTRARTTRESQPSAEAAAWPPMPARPLFGFARAMSASQPPVPPPSASTLAPPDSAKDASFSSCDSSFEAGTGDSPCAATGGRRPTLGDVPTPRLTAFPRRFLKRADTTTSVMVLPM